MKSAEFVRFIDRDFAFYGPWNEKLRNAGNALTPGLESVDFNAEHNFTLQYPVLVSPLRPTCPRSTLTVTGTAIAIGDCTRRRTAPHDGSWLGSTVL